MSSLSVYSASRIATFARAATGALSVFAVAALAAAAPLHAQARATPGPVIMSGGAVFDVVAPTFATPMDHDYKVVFVLDAASPVPASGGAGVANQQLNTVARFLNLSVRHGVDRSRIHLAAVVHGTAGQDMLDDATYRERYGTDNPSATLIKELVAAGVQVILCGQTAAGRNIPTDRLQPGVKFALSAMTALTVLQSEGYTYNPW